MKLAQRLGCLLGGTLVGLAVLTPATAAPARPETVRVYSNLCFNDESGDLNGERLLLVDAYTYQFVVYQSAADNRLSPPQAVDAKLTGDQIEFNVDLGGRALTFKGKITSAAIVGSFTINGDIRRLARTTNGIRPIPHCGDTH